MTDRARAEELAALEGRLLEDDLELHFPTRPEVGLEGEPTPLAMAADFAADNMSAEAFALEIDRIISG